MDDFGTMQLTVNIPAQKIHCAAMMLAEEYKPLVEEALREATFDLQKDSELRTQIKDRLKEKLRHSIIEAIENKIAKLASDFDYTRFMDIDKMAEEIFGGTLDRMINKHENK